MAVATVAALAGQPASVQAAGCPKVSGPNVDENVLRSFRQHVYQTYMGVSQPDLANTFPITADDRRQLEWHWFDKGAEKSNIGQVAQIFGYALAQQLGYFDKGSRQHCRWLQIEAGLQSRLLLTNFTRLSVHVARQKPEDRGRTARAIEHQVRTANKQFGAAIVGVYDQQMAVLTKVPVGKAPPYFGTPEKQVTIDREMLRNSATGKKYRQITTELEEIRNNAQKFEKGSPARKALVRAFAKLKIEREKLNESVKGIKGTRVTVLGPRAVTKTKWLATQVVDDLVKKPKWRGRRIYIWQSRRGDFEMDLNRPAKALVSMKP